ncbi:hypothetical protein QJS10_CPA09g00789 [Acorus calamus]|uniref:Uncharacterized protein n=1 Tax=Acorus calamus TaxID=4465 RepID=A0AAV9E5Q5_ACOCL|nr:hypothetical protein QJS10_CPA09g00789 [Acorus calamus]
MGRQFLWVVRPDLIEKAKMAISEGFEERVAGRGRMVGLKLNKDAEGMVMKEEIG